MCYRVFLSTTSGLDLALHNTNLLRFAKLTDDLDEPVTKHLAFPHRWYVGSESDCSCTFRHAMYVDQGFEVPQDWCPEQVDAIDGTCEMYDVVASLLHGGARVDLIDFWDHSAEEIIEDLTLFSKDINRATFRLFENCRFVFSNGDD